MGKDGEFLGLYEPPQYREPDPFLVARGVVPVEYLTAERFRGCTAPDHVRDVLLAEGDYPRPVPLQEDMEDKDEKWIEAYKERVKGWQKDYDKRRKAARERVRKRRQRAG